MRHICLDTSAYSHFKRGDPPAVKVVESAMEVDIPAIVLGELRVGFRLGTRADRNEEELQRFLAESTVKVLEVDDDAAAIYAEILVILRREGTPLPTNDIWIAAVAAREGAIVITYDEHFERIRRVGTHLLRR